MNAPSTTPRRITVSTEEQSFTIDWADGHRSVFPLDGLRRACPCAHCRGGHEHMHERPDPALLQEPPRRAWNDVQVEQAGSIGLRLTWDDGHDAGLYTWEYLRTMSPQ